MAGSISSAVKYIRLGDFEVEFPDTITCDPNGPQLGIQLHNLVLASAVKYLKRQNVLDAAVRIEGGPERFLGYDTSDPLQFSYYKSAGSRQRETQWSIELSPLDIDSKVLHRHDAFLIKSNRGYHWKYESEHNVIILEQNYPGQENCPENLFFIDHDVYSISPFDAPNKKAIISTTQQLPPLNTKFRRINLGEGLGGFPLELHTE